METEALVIVAVVANLAISVGYAVLGGVFATKFDAAAPTRALLAFKLSAGCFFLFCAATHVHMAWHIWTGVVDDPISFHALAIHIPQAVGAIVASWLAASVISLRVFDRSFYGPFLEREISRRSVEMARDIRQADIEAVGHEARRVAEAAELIVKAMRGAHGDT